ncbi:MAG: 4-hydroxyphenylpyruvate dioxygenase family protein [Thermoplasmatota archaeon]
MSLENLGIKRLESVDFVVHDIDRSRAFYEDKMDYRLVATSNPEYEEATGERTMVFDAARVRVQCSSPRQDADPSTSHAAKFLRSHPDGIRYVQFLVEDLDHTWKTLADRGANIVGEPTGDDQRRAFSIASPLGDVEYAFVQKKDEAAVDSRLTAVAYDPAAPTNRHGFTHMDHITSNTRDMRSLTNWYRDVLGFEHFWDIRFHTQDSNPDAVGSGLNSIVMRDPKSNVKFATNEPLRPNFYGSQIQKYVEDNNGPGVQHVALSTGKIMDVIPDMRQAGCKFLETPDAYYEMLPQRMAEREVENLKEDLEDLRRNKILVDGADNRYLLQIFMQEGSLLYDEVAAGPFFYEVIQRHGEQGFGEGNFRALFESIERQQTGETQRTQDRPSLVN